MEEITHGKGLEGAEVELAILNGVVRGAPAEKGTADQQLKVARE